MSIPNKDKLLDLNNTSIDLMVSEHEISLEIAKYIASSRPYRRVSDLFKNKDLISNIDADNLFKVISGARSLPQDTHIAIEEKSLHNINKQVIYGSRKLINGRTEIFISTSENADIISAEYDSISNKIDYSTTRFATYEPWDLLCLHWEDRIRITKFLLSKKSITAGFLWKEFQKNRNLYPVASHLSQILRLFQDAIQIVKHSHRDGEKCDSNGCTSVPDFDIKQCCDEHDTCYCIGGTEENRQECDNNFYKCIKKKGHDVLAAIYRLGVEALGDSHFNYKTSIEYIEAIPTIEYIYPNNTLAPESKNCHVKVKILQVSYNGKNIGNDWSYKVGVEGNDTKILNNGTHNHGAIQYFDERVVFDKVFNDLCGASFFINISASANENDSLVDDVGSKQLNVKITCDPKRPLLQSQVDLEVIVAEKKWHGSGNKLARLTFTFKIDTRCQ